MNATKKVGLLALWRASPVSDHPLHLASNAFVSRHV